MSSSGNVKVVCRFRPQLENELLKGGAPIAFIDESGKTVSIEGQRKAVFSFDRVFGEGGTQEEIYDYAARPIVEDVLKGYNGTIFAYGQTSSGKTHTMEGPDIDGPERGIIPRIVHNIFQYIDLAPGTLEFTVRVSYFEIYMEKIRDLLCDGNDNLEIHENRERGVYVRHATEIYMQDPEDVLEVMRAGAERRAVASTNMNDISSRSHSVFLMEIAQKDTVKGGIKKGKLFLVDLAGSEKVSKTGADGAVLDEAKNINKSLSALGLVIMTLTNGQTRQHVPYRDSKLTRILQESLGGNSRTTIVVCCSPSSYNESETLSTLRFGQFAKKIKNNAVINIQYSAEELQKMLDSARKEIKKLVKRLQLAEAELKIWRSGGTVSEEDRVALSAEAGGAVSLGESGEDEGQQGGGLSEAEREELLQRETELLDLLDDKDAHIKDLEREIELLGQDKITITKLAAEKAQLQEQLQEKEEHEEELMAENAEYEMAIEDMALANNKLDAELKMLEQSREEIETELARHKEEFASKMAALNEAIGIIPTPDATLRPTNTTCDSNLVKVKERFADLQSEADKLAQAREEAQKTIADLRKKSDEVEKELAGSKLSLTQAQSKVSELEKAREELKSELADVRAKRQALQDKMESMMSDLVESKEKLQGAQQAEEMRKTLEAQREEYSREHQLQVDNLREQLETTKADYDKLMQEKNEVELELDSVRKDLARQQEQVQEQQEQLETMNRQTETAEKKEKKLKMYEDRARQQIDKFEEVKTKMRSQIMENARKVLSAIKDNAPIKPGAQPKAVVFLEEEVEKLRTHNQDLAKTNAQLQRELTVLQKQSQERYNHIKNLQENMRASEERYQKALARVRPGKGPAIVRGGSQHGEAKPTVRGGQHRGSQDRSMQQFWKSQQGMSSVRSSRSNIVDQGEPLVGQHAQQSKRESELTAVEFV